MSNRSSVRDTIHNFVFLSETHKSRQIFCRSREQYLNSLGFSSILKLYMSSPPINCGPTTHFPPIITIFTTTKNPSQSYLVITFLFFLFLSVYFLPNFKIYVGFSTHTNQLLFQKTGATTNLSQCKVSETLIRIHREIRLNFCLFVCIM